MLAPGCSVMSTAIFAPRGRSGAPAAPPLFDAFDLELSGPADHREILSASACRAARTSGSAAGGLRISMDGAYRVYFTVALYDGTVPNITDAISVDISENFNAIPTQSRNVTEAGVVDFTHTFAGTFLWLRASLPNLSGFRLDNFGIYAA